MGLRRGVATEAGVEDDDGDAGAGTEEEARPRRTARAGPMGGSGAQRGLLGRRSAGRWDGAAAAVRQTTGEGGRRQLR